MFYTNILRLNYFGKLLFDVILKRPTQIYLLNKNNIFNINEIKYKLQIILEVADFCK